MIPPVRTLGLDVRRDHHDAPAPAPALAGVVARGAGWLVPTVPPPPPLEAAGASPCTLPSDCVATSPPCVTPPAGTLAALARALGSLPLASPASLAPPPPSAAGVVP